MSEPNRCPKCGTELPADSPGGMCAKCLLQAGYESQSIPSSAYRPTSPSPPHGGFVPPTIEEVARHFPQLEVLALLGQGGMGAVYKARQPGLDRLVAIKILPPEVSRDPAFSERFTREARALARLGHPNIVSVYDFGQRDGLFFIVMEFVDGVNLRQAILAGGMSPLQALSIVPQICDALQFAHDEGIVHRDIKPENILLDKRGRVKIADFGLAKLFGAAADHTLTAEHQVMGTLRYMAPEQMEGTHSVDHRADIYSLGVVFYELLTGELPIGRFAPPSKKVEIDVRLDEVVLRALEKEPEQRYQQASQVKSEVEAIRAPTGAATSPGAAQPVSPHAAPTLAMRQWPIGTVLAALLAFAATFMPWGYTTVKMGVNELTVFTEVAVTGWISALNIGDAAIPNWIPAIVALIVAALALLQAGTGHRTRHFVLILAAYGIVHTTLMCSYLWANEKTGIGAQVTLAAFVVIFVANILPIIPSTSRAARRLARIPAEVALLGNLTTGFLGYFIAVRLISAAGNSGSTGRFPIWWTALVSALLLSLVVALLVFLAVRYSQRMQNWVTPIVQGLTLADRSVRTAFQAAIGTSVIASASGWIGLAAILLTRTGLVGYSPLLDLLSQFVFAIVISLLLAPPIYLVLRSGRRAATVSSSSKEQPARRDRPGSNLKSEAAAAQSVIGVPAPPAVRAPDPSGWVCAILAAVLFPLGLIVPATLTAFVNANDHAAVPATFIVGMVLAIVFGLLGWRYRLGKYTAAAAIVVLAGVLWMALRPHYAERQKNAPQGAPSSSYPDGAPNSPRGIEGDRDAGSRSRESSSEKGRGG